MNVDNQCWEQQTEKRLRCIDQDMVEFEPAQHIAGHFRNDLPSPSLDQSKTTSLLNHLTAHKTKQNYYHGVSVAQWLGRQTSDPAVMSSIPGPRVIRHLGQLSLPSLRGR